MLEILCLDILILLFFWLLFSIKLFAPMMDIVQECFGMFDAHINNVMILGDKPQTLENNFCLFSNLHALIALVLVLFLFPTRFLPYISSLVL